MVHVPVSHTGPGHGGRRELAGECAWLLGSWAGWDQALGAARALRCLSPQPPRPCEVYRAEWELCRSVGHVLHHYYVHGKRPDCRQWLRDLTNCREWEESRSAEAQRSLCESEQVRVQAAQKHTLVWALRQRPPTDWNLPLPQEKDK